MPSSLTFRDYNAESIVASSTMRAGTMKAALQTQSTWVTLGQAYVNPYSASVGTATTDQALIDYISWSNESGPPPVYHCLDGAYMVKRINIWAPYAGNYALNARNTTVGSSIASTTALGTFAAASSNFVDVNIPLVANNWYRFSINFTSGQTVASGSMLQIYVRAQILLSQPIPG